VVIVGSRISGNNTGKQRLRAQWRHLTGCKRGRGKLPGKRHHRSAGRLAVEVHRQCRGSRDGPDYLHALHRLQQQRRVGDEATPPNGLTQPSLWKFNVQNGMLANGSISSCTSHRRRAGASATTDSSPTPSGDGTWILRGDQLYPCGLRHQAATLKRGPGRRRYRPDVQSGHRRFQRHRKHEESVSDALDLVRDAVGRRHLRQLEERGEHHELMRGRHGHWGESL